MTLKRIFKLSGVALGFLILALVTIVAFFLIRGGAFRTVSAVFPGVCIAVQIEAGSAEDIQIDHDSGIALLSVLDRRGIVEGRDVKGTILALSLTTENSRPFEILASQPDDFRPHGISLHVADDGLRSLFVINHSSSGEFIEVFEKNSESDLYTHIKSLSTPDLKEPNDIVAVGSDNFYIASDSGASNSIERAAEMLFAVGLSPLIYYDGKQFEIVQDDLKSSGGINVSPAFSQLYVGETAGESMRVYALNPDRSLGDLAQTINIGSGIDNIDVTLDGELSIANHTNTLALVKHFGDSKSFAPSQIQKLVLENGKAPSITTVFENNGSLFSAASVGATYKNELVIGSITERKILRCKLTN